MQIALKRVYKLKDVIDDIHSGGTPSTKQSEYWGGNLKWLSSGETSNSFIYETVEKITESGVKNSSTKLAKKNDVVLACAGQGKTRGQVSYLEDDMYINQSVIALTANKSILDSLYLFYNLKNRYKELRGGSDSSSTRGSITTTSLKNLYIELPPLSVQQKIVSVLHSYDKLIQNHKKQIENLQNLASELYKEWFVRFRFPGHEKTSFENGIPAGWKYVKISTAYNSSSGGTPSRQCLEYYENGIYPWIKTGELKDSLILESEEYITESAIQNSSAKLFEKDSLIIAMYGATIGQIGINKMQATCNQACCVLRPKDNVPCGIYYLYMFFLFNRNYLISLGSGAAQQNLSQVVINKLNFLLPKTEVIEQFEKLEKSIFDRMCVFQKKISVISKQRDLLLPRLMSGELEVK